MHHHVSPLSNQLPLPRLLPSRILGRRLQNPPILLLSLDFCMLTHITTQERSNEGINSGHDPVCGTWVDEEREIGKGFVACADECEEDAVRVADEAVEAGEVGGPECETGGVDYLLRRVSQRSANVMARRTNNGTSGASFLPLTGAGMGIGSTLSHDVSQRPSRKENNPPRIQRHGLFHRQLVLPLRNIPL